MCALSPRLDHAYVCNLFQSVNFSHVLAKVSKWHSGVSAHPPATLEEVFSLSANKTRLVKMAREEVP